LSHHIEYFFALTGTMLAQLLTPRQADFMGKFLGTASHGVLTSRRRIAFNNLKRAMGDSLSDEEIAVIVKKVFQNISLTTIEFARFKKIKLAGVKKIVVTDDRELLERAYNEDRGVIIVTAHFGNWELLGSWVAAMGYPMNFLVGTQHNLKVDRLLIDFRKEMDVGIIPLKSALKGVFKALKSKEYVGLVADQHDPTGGLVLDFFGRKVTAAKGPAAFAVKQNSLLLPLLLRRERYDRHVVIPGDIIYPPNTGDNESDIRNMTIAYTKFFEENIRRYPDQWMWTHRRWKLQDT